MASIRKSAVQTVLNRVSGVLNGAVPDYTELTTAKVKKALRKIKDPEEKKLVESAFELVDKADGTQDGKAQYWQISNALSVYAYTQKRDISDRELKKMPQPIQLAAKIAMKDLGAATSVRGSLADNAGMLQFTAADGHKLFLKEPTATSDYLDMTPTWMGGFAGDGPVVLQGTKSADGKQFHVEGFALDTNGKFGTFLFGRVNAEEKPGKVLVCSARGDVEITNPQLKAKLNALPRLGIILPGEPKSVRSKLVYDQDPEEFFALSRIVDYGSPPDGPAEPGKVLKRGDMAYSVFSGKPLILPEEFADRTTAGGRIWLRGMVRLDEQGKAKDFVASYVSRGTDSQWLETVDG
jgi:hypothetical protein